MAAARGVREEKERGAGLGQAGPGWEVWPSLIVCRLSVCPSLHPLCHPSQTQTPHIYNPHLSDSAPCPLRMLCSFYANAIFHFHADSPLSSSPSGKCLVVSHCVREILLTPLGIVGSRGSVLHRVLCGCRNDIGVPSPPLDIVHLVGVCSWVKIHVTLLSCDVDSTHLPTRSIQPLAKQGVLGTRCTRLLKLCPGMLSPHDICRLSPAPNTWRVPP